jgi:hypothetical protein
MSSKPKPSIYPYSKVTTGSNGLGLYGGIHLDKIGTGNTMLKNIKQNNMYKPYSIKNKKN